MSDDDNRHPHLRLVPGTKDAESEQAGDQHKAFTPPHEERRALPPPPGYWSSLFDLTNQTALVLGTTEPVGLGIATGLADFGARVAVAERQLESAKAAARAATRPGKATALAMNMDPAQPEQVRRGIAVVEQITGGIDALVIVVSLGAPFPARHPERTDAPPTLQEAIHLVRATARRMAGRGGGRIVLVAAGVPSDPAIAALAIGGLSELVKTMAASFTPLRVSINTLIVPHLIEARTDAPTNAAPPGRRPAATEGLEAPSSTETIAPTPSPTSAEPESPGGQAPAEEQLGDEDIASAEPPVMSFPSGGRPVEETAEGRPVTGSSPGNLPLSSVIGAALYFSSSAANYVTGQTVTIGNPDQLGAAPQ